MADRFAELTAFIPSLKNDAFGEWVIDRENDGTPEHPKQMPFVNYTGVAEQFIHTLFAYCEAHPAYEHTVYGRTLDSFGITWGAASMEKADVSGMDAKGVIALLVGAVRAERFCDGALLAFFKKGCILRWLERLAEIDRLT